MGWRRAVKKYSGYGIVKGLTKKPKGSRGEAALQKVTINEPATRQAGAGQIKYTSQREEYR